MDVSDPAAVVTAGEKILADAGKVDVFVNNAGVTWDGLLMPTELVAPESIPTILLIESHCEENAVNERKRQK